MADFLLKLRLLSEIILTIICFYLALEVNFTHRLPNLVFFGIGIFSVFCTAGTIDKIQHWGRHQNDKD